MRINLKSLVVAVGIMGMAVQAEALTIVPSTVDCDPIVTPVCLYTTGNDTSEAVIQGILAGLFNPDLTLGLKQDVGGAETGPGAPYYETTFSNDNSDALIEWTGGLFFTTNPLYLLVKDGNASPAWYLFRIAVGGAGNWNGTDDLVLDGFWEGTKGEISHLALYGSTGPDLFCTNCETVPDGGSATILLGMGLLGLAALRRRMGRI